jgi:hypothetical protein
MFRSAIIIRRPSPALFLAIMALFVALGGTGYAAATFSGKNLIKRSVPGDRIMLNGLTGTQINESRLGEVPKALSSDTALTAKSADAALTAKSADTAKTADKALDADKLQGKPATAFMASTVRVAQNQTAPVPGTGGGVPATVTVSCAPDERAISGGGGWFIPGLDEQTALNAPVTASTPVLGPENQITGWRVSGRNISGVDRILRANALCVPKAT